MNEPENFALVPSPPGALEKAEPGAKRILSGMVADTLALVRKELQSKREIHVLMAGAPEFFDFFSFIVPMADDLLKEHFHFHFYSCQRMEELADALKQRKFDLALVQLHSSPPAEHKFTDKREVMLRVETLLAKNQYIVWAGLEVAFFLHTVHRIPVVMVSDIGHEEVARLLAGQAGARALFPWVGMDIRAFGKFLRAILPQPGRMRPVKIVILHHDEGLLEVLSSIVWDCCPNATVATILDNEQSVILELERGDPDVFITDPIMPKMNARRVGKLLSSRKAAYPVIMFSPWPPREEWVRDCAGAINAKFVPRMYSRTYIRAILEETGVKTSEMNIEQYQSKEALVVSDHNAFWFMATAILRELGANSELVHGDEAWQVLSRAIPDLLILNSTAQGIEIPTLLRLLAQRKVKYPILVTTAGLVVYPEHVRRNWCFGLNVTFLTDPIKPADIEPFRAAVEAVLQKPDKQPR